MFRFFKISIIISYRFLKNVILSCWIIVLSCFVEFAEIHRMFEIPGVDNWLGLLGKSLPVEHLQKDGFYFPSSRSSLHFPETSSGSVNCLLQLAAKSAGNSVSVPCKVILQGNPVAILYCPYMKKKQSLTGVFRVHPADVMRRPVRHLESHLTIFFIFFFKQKHNDN